MKPRTTLLALLVVGLIGLMAGVSQAGPGATLIGGTGWYIEFQARTYLGGETTFYYEVGFDINLYTGPLPAHDLSHLSMALPYCVDGAGSLYQLTPVAWSPDNSVEFGVDPTTGTDGIKWDIGRDKNGGPYYYSITFDGDIPGAIDAMQVAFKASTEYSVQSVFGPICSGGTPPAVTYTISGYAFLDPANQGYFDNGEPIIGGVTIELYDGNGVLIDTTTTDGSGYYIFSGLLPGDYTVSVPATGGINDTLSAFFVSTTGVSIGVTIVDANITDVNFGWDPNLPVIPPAITGEGHTIGYWKHQLSVMLTGRGRMHEDPNDIMAVLTLYADDFGFTGNLVQEAYDLLTTNTSDMSILLAKQLLGTIFSNELGYSLDPQFSDLQDLLIDWGIYLMNNSGLFTRDELEDAKDLFDYINNL